MRKHYKAFAGGEVGRIEALSDGIFAFAATVLGARLSRARAGRYPFRGRTAPRPGCLGAPAPALALMLGIFWVAVSDERLQENPSQWKG
jgi:hypothetical protein